MGDDGAVYSLADWEWFNPLSDVSERFANRQGIRTGVGFRQSVAWPVLRDLHVDSLA